MVSRWDKGPTTNGDWDPGGPPPVSKRTKLIAFALTAIFLVVAIVFFCLIFGQFLGSLPRLADLA